MTEEDVDLQKTPVAQQRSGLHAVIPRDVCLANDASSTINDRPRLAPPRTDRGGVQIVVHLLPDFFRTNLLVLQYSTSTA